MLADVRSAAVLGIDAALHRRVMSVRLDSGAAWLRDQPSRAANFAVARNHLTYMYEPLTARQRSRRKQLGAEADGQAGQLRRREALEGVDGRKAFAVESEGNMLNQGYDVHVRVEGPYGTTLRLEWIAVTRPLAYKLIGSEQLTARLRALGFRRVVVTEGLGETYSSDIH